MLYEAKIKLSHNSFWDLYNKEENFDSVKFMREQRDKLTEKILKMTKKEIIEYFKKVQETSNVKPSGI